MEWIEVIILVATFGILMVLGVPISFCIGIATMATMLVTILPGPALTTIAQRMATGLDSFALLAIPFFVLSGQFMNRGGIARRLIELAKVLVGRLPGGLAFVNILANMFFGSISGSAAAAASAVGGFMAPIMEKEGYDRGYSAAVNISSATTGLLIPPSNILIVYSLASGGVSIAALFLAGYLPGILMGVLLMVVAAGIAVARKYPVGNNLGFRDGFLKFLDAIPSLLLIIIVMGGIVAGYFTATEASAIAVLYTFILSVVVYREVKWRELPSVFLAAASTTAIVMLLIGTSMGMSWILAYTNIPQNVSAALLSLTENKILLLLIINLILLAIGTFMDMTPAVLIFTPIFLPVAMKLGIDPIHFGIIVVMNLCIGLCTPPVGSVLFIGVGVANTTIAKVIRPLIPMFLAMVAALMLVTYLPDITMFIPRLFGY